MPLSFTGDPPRLDETARPAYAQATAVPELPDVEAFRQRFARYAVGRTVAEVVVTDQGILRNVSAGELDSALRGRRFDEPERRGKWLIAWTDGASPLIHFGMTGDIEWADDADGRHVHDRVIFVLDRGEIRYRNMRKLGGLWLARDARDVETLLGRLGPDAASIDRRDFLHLLERRRGGIKAALMDQSFLAGVGNLLADEILWQARIHPLRTISELSAEERSRLFRALRTVIARTVERYPEGYETRWTSARGRPQARCPRCRTELARTVVGGRTTYFCPNCQAGRNRSALHVSSSAT
jgi:formamidopyrimidine-DNA glycosylase